MNATFLVLGLVSLVIAALLARYPAFTNRVNAQTNLRGVGMWAKTGYRTSDESIERSLRILRVALPGFFLVCGVVLVLGGLL